MNNTTYPNFMCWGFLFFGCWMFGCLGVFDVLRTFYYENEIMDYVYQIGLRSFMN